ncbi:retrovirus-related pol polyprotein from transposon TNT 1-94 [Tanacetum coccineum]
MIMTFLKGGLDHICKSSTTTVAQPIEMGEYDVPNELIHRIQSLFPANDAARTCVLSKTWLHAWSTINTLRFAKCVPHGQLTMQGQIDYIKCINRTLLRHHNENTSIECFHLQLDDIHNSSLLYPLENWFQALAFTNCIKELSLTMCSIKVHTNVNEVIGWLTLPDAIFSYEKLDILYFFSFTSFANVIYGPYTLFFLQNPAFNPMIQSILHLPFNLFHHHHTTRPTPLNHHFLHSPTPMDPNFLSTLPIPFQSQPP